MPEFDVYAWVILPFLVFLARITDVTLGTLRIIFTSRGKRNIAPLLGFIEVFIWIVVVSQIVKSVNSITAYIGYAAGFAAGTYLGMKIEERLALGTLVLRIILPTGGDEMAASLRLAGYGVTIVNGEGSTGSVKLLYTVINAKTCASWRTSSSRSTRRPFSQSKKCARPRAGFSRSTARKTSLWGKMV